VLCIVFNIVSFIQKGNFFLADTNKIKIAINFISTFVGNNFNGNSGDAGSTTNAKIGIYHWIYNKVYVIRKVNLLTNIITTVAGTCSLSFNEDNILAINVNIGYVGKIYFSANNRISKMTI
jgi:hypothetical protein